jgi:hypothetical protein
VTIQEFLARFDQKKPTGGQWLVRCPAHGDNQASLAAALQQPEADLFGSEAA